LPTSLHEDTHGYGKSNASRLDSASSEFFNENLNRGENRVRTQRGKIRLRRKNTYRKAMEKWIIENG